MVVATGAVVLDDSTSRNYVGSGCRHQVRVVKNEVAAIGKGYSRCANRCCFRLRCRECVDVRAFVFAVTVERRLDEQSFVVQR